MPTSYEIYQTYLRGPAAVIRLFEQALGTQAIYGAPTPGFVLLQEYYSRRVMFELEGGL